MKLITYVVAGIVSVIGVVGCAVNTSPTDPAESSGSSIVVAPIGGDAGCAGVGSVICINGGHWDSQLCECVPPADAACVDNVLCIEGDHWDSTLCKCAPDSCCPAGWDMYSCREANGGSGYNCHNPALGCASSLTCGGGCDFQVTRRCVVCDPLVCPAGEKWDPVLCKCGPVGCVTAADCTGPLPEVCMVCPSGGAGCAHWICAAGQCQIGYCP